MRFKLFSLAPRNGENFLGSTKEFTYTSLIYLHEVCGGD
jgi:hypothetical protein